MTYRSLARRTFLQHAGTTAAGCALYCASPPHAGDRRDVRITIRRVRTHCIREKLRAPFGFKGGYLTEKWLPVVQMESESGQRTVGMGSLSVLWCDPAVYAAHTETDGNTLMLKVLERAAAMAQGRSFTTPQELLHDLVGPVTEYAVQITGLPALRKTFVLDAVTALDNAAWLMYAAENGIGTFDTMLPEDCRPALSHRHSRVACVPLVSYGTTPQEIAGLVDSGFFFLKIKIGQPGAQKDMLEADKARLTQIHSQIGGRDTPHTQDGRIPYYFDANGRYESRETLLRLLDHLDAIGALDRVALLEEPFPEMLDEAVGDLPVRVAADESAETVQKTLERIDRGYGAVAVKAVAKTLSETLAIITAARTRNIPVFCPDSTAPPLLVEWNKNIAARLAPLPGLYTGLLETNGHQNYARWDAMMREHPCAGASWAAPRDGLFVLDDDYYRRSGGIFAPVPGADRWFPGGVR